jgi:glycosyltransferase involved in cell wall biosynthesis
VKIALITDGLGHGGAERQIVTATGALARKGMDAWLVTYGAPNDYEDQIRRLGVRVFRVHSRGPLAVKRMLEMGRFLRRERFDVVHAFKECACFHGRLAARWAGVPVVFGGYRGETAVGLGQRVLNHVLTWNTPGWIVNSELLKQFVMRHFWLRETQVAVVPNGLDTEVVRSELSPAEARRSLGLPGEAQTVTMVGALRIEKNYPRLLRIARLVVARAPRVLFLIAGDGPERVAVESGIQSLGLGANVRLLGHRRDIGDILRATDVAVLTSDREGIPNSLLEAGAAGLPSVCVNNGGGAFVLRDGETGFLLPLDDDAGFAEKVLALLADPGLRERVGHAARERVRNQFTVEAMADNLLAVYRRALDSAGKGARG